jgi:parallel beta-helix repeat protein
VWDSQDFGIELLGANNNTVSGNVVSGEHHFDGIVMAGASDNVVDRNTVGIRNEASSL